MPNSSDNCHDLFIQLTYHLSLSCNHKQFLNSRSAIQQVYGTLLPSELRTAIYHSGIQRVLSYFNMEFDAYSVFSKQIKITVVQDFLAGL